MIKIENATKIYRTGTMEYHALKGIDLNIQAGELVAIVGPSGSGKSTIMNLIGLLDRPTEGKYYLNEKDTSDLTSDERAEWRNINIGFVFQQFLLLPRLNALHNVMLPLQYRKHLTSRNRHEQALEALTAVGMEPHIKHRPYELSGGQQQRVAIARALAGKPNILLADEPTGALDTKTSDLVMELIQDINRNQKVTIVIVTHDLDVAKECHRQIVIHDGLIHEKFANK